MCLCVHVCAHFPCRVLSLLFYFNKLTPMEEDESKARDLASSSSFSCLPPPPPPPHFHLPSLSALKLVEPPCFKRPRERAREGERAREPERERKRERGAGVSSCTFSCRGAVRSCEAVLTPGADVTALKRLQGVIGWGSVGVVLSLSLSFSLSVSLPLLL